MKKQLFFIAVSGFSFAFSACLPALMERDLRQDARPASKINDLDKRFNRAENLHRYGDAPVDWLADQRHQVYAGVATPVRLNVSEKAIVTISTGTIRRDSIDKDLFYIESELSGISANISAKEYTKTGESEQIWQFSIQTLPLPQLRLTIPHNFARVAAADMQRLRAFDLVASVAANDVIDFLCPCKSFELQRLPAEGQRKSVLSSKGDFSPDIITLLKQAQSGDIYIFKQVKTACTAKEKQRTLPSYAFDVE
jgi:hypothetical protein